MSQMLRMIRLAVVALPAMTLMACASSSVPQMNAVNMTGDDFNHHLARDYQALATYEYDEMYDMADASLYADKAMAAAGGSPLVPDDLSNRRIGDDAAAAELRTARARLMQAFATGARHGSPGNAANAQSNFDCWVEQQEEGHQYDHIAACKDGFHRVMLAIETAMAPAPARAQSMIPRPATPAVTQPATYRLFFDWDRSALTDGARGLVDQAIRSNRATGQRIHLIGHADSSGSDAYNMRLSQRRANAVTDYLVANGVARSAITSEARGQRDALVPTADGVREPQNRNVSIELSTHKSGV